jgi:glycosyltransferase involved in cell wall biosynthesis
MLPKITIIIPTRDRADVLEKTLMALSLITYPNYEVLVSDNSSEDGTENVCSKFSFVRHIKTNARISMSHNWEFALDHVNGEWVTIIGDDDAVLPSGLTKVSEVINKRPDIDFIRTLTASYWWPGVGGVSGRIVIPGFRGKIFERNSKRYLNLAKAGIVSHTELPMLYNGGYARLTLLRNMKSKFGGNFYHSAIPDVFSAVAIADNTTYYLYFDYPTAVNGASKHSTGTSQFTLNKNKDEVNPAAKFISEANIPFHKNIPLIPNHGYPPASISFVYESFFQACDIVGKKIGKYDIFTLGVIAIAQTKEPYRQIIKDWATNNSLGNNKISYLMVSAFLYRAVLNLFRLHNFSIKLIRRVKRVSNDVGVDDIYQAAKVIDAIILPRKNNA